MDAITAGRILQLHPKVRDEVMLCVEIANKKLTGRAQVRIVQGLRTFPEQSQLYSLGRTAVNTDGKSARKPFGNTVTKAKAGESYHNYGLAGDFALLVDGKVISWDTTKDYDQDNIADWTEVLDVFDEHGYTLGKSFGDQPHFEKNFGLNWRELLHRYSKGDWIKGTKYVRI